MGGSYLTFNLQELCCDIKMTENPLIYKGKPPLFLYVLLAIFCEVTKQITNYTFRVKSGGVYPLPEILIVLFIELVKLVITITRAIAKGEAINKFTPSVKFMFPSLCYLISNLIYWNVLKIVPVPIWILILHLRLPVTAFIYKYMLHREVSLLQWCGTILIVLSVAINKIPDLIDSSNVHIPFTAIIL